MFSSYEQFAKEQFYPISRLALPAPSPAEPVLSAAQPAKRAAAGLAEALQTVFHGKGEELDTGKLLLLLITILIFSEDIQSESELLIVAAAAFLLGL